MVILGDILMEVEILSHSDSLDMQVEKISFDSRTVEQGDLFVAVRGTVTDGHKYIPASVNKGAVAIICEELPGSPVGGVNYIRVKNSAIAMARAASAYYNYPSKKLRLVGVTGTNGKTTVATLLYRLFTSLGYASGLLSTAGNMISGRQIPATHTTPDPLRLNSLLNEMVIAGCEYAFMEVSSIALDQHRTDGVSFAGAIFTNITHDHLDYHGTFDNYIAAKKTFFDKLDSESFALVNTDDRRSAVMLQNCTGRKAAYSMKQNAEYRGRLLEERLEGMLLKIGDHDVSTHFIGAFNAYNLLAVYGTALELGADETEVLTGISMLTPVEGRLEIIRSRSGQMAIVDYAHTPDALENVISAINRIVDGSAELVIVIGAGGNRDRSKRPLMGKIASTGSTKVILTSDNPRSENPERIIEEMEEGVPHELRSKVLKITDRREAIRTALMLAGEKGIVLVAGKGHETYQEIKGVKSHFDDREEIRKVFNI